MQGESFLGAKTGLALTSERNMRPVVLLTMFATVTVFSNMYTTQPVLPIIGAEFSLTPAQAGLSVSALVLAIAASSVFYGLLSDRVGRKPVMVASVLGLAVPTFLCAIVPSFGWLIAFRVGQGLLIPGYTAITITYLQEEISTRQRGMALSYYVAATVMGGFFGRLSGGLITDLSGSWRLAFVFYGFLDAGLAWVLWRYLPASRHFQGRHTPTHDEETLTAVAEAESGQTARFSPAALLVHLGNRNLLGTYVIGFCMMYSFLGLFTYLPYYLGRPPFELSTLLISLVYIVYLVGVFSAPFSARLAARVGGRQIIQVGFGLMLVGVLITLVQFLPLIIVGLVIICFGMFACQSTATALVGESVKASGARGSAVALYQMFFYIGGSCGGFVPGLFWQVGGWPPVVVGVVLAVLSGLAAVTWLCR